MLWDDEPGWDFSKPVGTGNESPLYCQFLNPGVHLGEESSTDDSEWMENDSLCSGDTAETEEEDVFFDFEIDYDEVAYEEKFLGGDNIIIPYAEFTSFMGNFVCKNAMGM